MPRALRPSLVRALIALMWLWLAATSFTSVGAAVTSGHLAAHRILGGIAERVPTGVVGSLVGALQLGAALLLVLPGRWSAARRIGAALSGALGGVALTLLTTNPVWMESLGGFPAIGSGQGLLKYAAVLGLSVYLWGVEAKDERAQRLGMSLTVAGLILPLAWIGGMKFTLPEAEGIQGLLTTSPFFAWMTRVFSVQGASNVIGVSELITVAFLAMYWKRPDLAAVGGALGVGTFLATLSFLVTAPGWHTELGFPLLSGGGVFLVKDLGLLAASAAVVLAWLEERAESLNEPVPSA